MTDQLRIGRVVLFLSVLMLTTASSPQLLRQVYAASPTFSSAVNLSKNSGNSTFPVMAVSGRCVYVAWQDDSPGNPEIFFAESNNNGSSFAPAVNLSNNTGGSYNPEIAASGSYVYVAWQDNTPGTDQIFFRASSNNGTTFGRTINVSNSTRNSDIPQIAVSGSNVYLVWQEATAKNPDIFFRASNNNGASFNPTINLSNNPGFSLTPQISASQNMVYVTWRDTTNSTGNDETFFALSSNNGASFSTPRDISNNPATSYQQKIASLANNVYLTWEDDSPGRVDVTFKASVNRGASFGPALNISGTGVGTLPEIAVAGSSVYVAWKDYSRLNPQIFFRASNNNGTSFNPKVNLSNDTTDDTDQQIASFGSNVYVTWDDTGQAYFMSSDNSGGSFSGKVNLSNDAGVAVNPGIAASANNVYVAWQDNTLGKPQIMFRSGTVTSPAFDFSLSNSGGITASQGASGSNMITASLVSGTSQPVTLSCTSGLPAGVSCTFTVATGFPTFSSTLTITASSSTPTGSFTITITGTGGGLTRSTQFTLTVAPQPFNFTLSSPSPNTLSVVQGSTSVPSSLTATLTSGTATPVTFSSSPLPSGVTSVFTNNPCSPTCTATVQFSATNTATLGTTTVTISASGGGVTQTQTLSLTVNAPFDFSLSNSGDISLVQGGSGFNTITVNIVSGTSQPVTLSVSGLPAGASPSFTGGCTGSPTCAGSPTFSSTLTITTLSSTPTGSYSVTVTGSGGGITRVGSFTLMISGFSPGGGRVART